MKTLVNKIYEQLIKNLNKVTNFLQMTINEIDTELKITQTKIIQHLKKLSMDDYRVDNTKEILQNVLY